MRLLIAIAEWHRIRGEVNPDVRAHQVDIYERIYGNQLSEERL